MLENVKNLGLLSADATSKSKHQKALYRHKHRKGDASHCILYMNRPGFYRPPVFLVLFLSAFVVLFMNENFFAVVEFWLQWNNESSDKFYCSKNPLSSSV